MAARLGRRERLAKRMLETALRIRKEETARLNLSLPKPDKSLLSRDETAKLLGNTHTRGIRIGSQRTGVEIKNINNRLHHMPKVGRSGEFDGAIKHHPTIGQLGTGKPKK